ncbi:hypothetical protein [Natronorarus salvus]|uniref:hypothetical protein n=1 Tax=Natronorarus salvus TaxID=3117733 RepID=UPI002F25F1BB
MTADATVRDPVTILEGIGGLALALVGLGTLAGVPWPLGSGIVLTVAQIVAALAAVGIGIGLILLSGKRSS